MDNIFSISVNVGKSYPVYIDKDLLSRSGEIFASLFPNCKIAVISDDLVASLYLDKLISSLNLSGFKVVSYVFPNGEQNKNLSTFSNIVNFLADNEITRSDVVVALGGGVVGDVVGFASASYLRGVKYVQIPTTLLSATDSSVGGKTAIDIEQGKNLVGAFKQPDAVICDVDVIKNLPSDIFKSGMGEVVKYAILDRDIFSAVSTSNLDLANVIALCVDYKRKIVEQDEFESGLRRLLNLGHTPAHAIEKLSDYSIPHGIAVSMGLKIMVDYSFKAKLLCEKDYKLISELISSVFGDCACPYSAKLLAEHSLSDKKRSGEFINVLVVHAIGDVRQHKIHVSDLIKVFQ